MAEKEVILNNPGGDAAVAAGDEKASLPPLQKKQKVGEELQGSVSEEGTSTSTTPLDPDEEEYQLLDSIARESAMSEEDDALEAVSSLFSRKYPNGCCKGEGDKWFKYLRRIVESEGFDINLDELPEVDNAKLPFVPMLKLHARLGVRAKCAISHFNKKTDTNYQFVKVVKANARLWGPGANFYITFQAVPENSDPAHGLTTFEGLVVSGGMSGPFVKFCRLKTLGS